MGASTKIEWCDHTWNPWIGCTRLSAACDHCYAADLARRYGWATWGAGEPRRRTSATNWRQPLIWNARALRDGVRRRVFCASLADVFDAEVPDAWRADLYALITVTPQLDWLLLTKRPQVARKWFTAHPAQPNVWLGTTVESQAMADLRIPQLLAVPGVTVRFLSCEPLLEAIDVLPHLFIYTHQDSETLATAPPDVVPEIPFRDPLTTPASDICCPRIDWVIAGGESGPKARPSHPDWFRALRDQCRDADVPFFFKQWGEWAAAARSFAVGRLDPKFTVLNGAGPPVWMERVGKKHAGAQLDGREWREFPR